MRLVVCYTCGALQDAEGGAGDCINCNSHLPGIGEPVGAEVRHEGGEYLVSRRFTNEAAAQRGLNLLLTVNEAAFDPGATLRFGIGGKAVAYDAHPGSLNLPSNEDGS